ncbi:hypothetical protein DIPPA_54176 [Diplonema papillatum]|nr:hypothetical protein DIPPA_54176 [Diplonema papillatum]
MADGGDQPAHVKVGLVGPQWPCQSGKNVPQIIITIGRHKGIGTRAKELEEILGVDSIDDIVLSLNAAKLPDLRPGEEVHLDDTPANLGFHKQGVLVVTLRRHQENSSSVAAEEIRVGFVGALFPLKTDKVAPRAVTTLLRHKPLMQQVSELADALNVRNEDVGNRFQLYRNTHRLPSYCKGPLLRLDLSLFDQGYTGSQAVVVVEEHEGNLSGRSFSTAQSVTSFPSMLSYVSKSTAGSYPCTPVPVPVPVPAEQGKEERPKRPHVPAVAQSPDKLQRLVALQGAELARLRSQLSARRRETEHDGQGSRNAALEYIRRIRLQPEAVENLLVTCPRHPTFTGVYSLAGMHENIPYWRCGNCCLRSSEGHWVVADTASKGAIMRSSTPHGGTLPQRQKLWLEVDQQLGAWVATVGSVEEAFALTGAAGAAALQAMQKRHDQLERLLAQSTERLAATPLLVTFPDELDLTGVYDPLLSHHPNLPFRGPPMWKRTGTSDTILYSPTRGVWTITQNGVHGISANRAVASTRVGQMFCFPHDTSHFRNAWTILANHYHCTRTCPAAIIPHSDLTPLSLLAQAASRILLESNAGRSWEAFAKLRRYASHKKLLHVWAVRLKKDIRDSIFAKLTRCSDSLLLRTYFRRLVRAPLSFDLGQSYLEPTNRGVIPFTLNMQAPVIERCAATPPAVPLNDFKALEHSGSLSPLSIATSPVFDLRFVRSRPETQSHPLHIQNSRTSPVRSKFKRPALRVQDHNLLMQRTRHQNTCCEFPRDIVVSSLTPPHTPDSYRESPVLVGTPSSIRYVIHSPVRTPTLPSVHQTSLVNSNLLKTPSPPPPDYPPSPDSTYQPHQFAWTAASQTVDRVESAVVSRGPHLLCVICPGAPQLSGEYVKTASTQAAHPMWRTGDCTIYTTDDAGNWMMTDVPGTEVMNRGWVRSRGAHNGFLPHQISCWERWVCDMWVPDPAIRVFEDDNTIKSYCWK